MAKVTQNISIDHLIQKQVNFWRAQSQKDRREKEEEMNKEPWHRGYVTISRLMGSGGAEIAERTAELLGWKVLDREVVHQIASSSKMRQQVIETLDEKKQSEIQNFIQGIIDSDTFSPDRYLHHLMRVITTIASHGKAVFIGRGANFILDPRIGVRINIYAPEKLRIRRIMEKRNKSEKEAIKLIHDYDNQRLAFIRQYFHRDADHPSGYDLIINTGEICAELAAHIIKETLIGKYKTLFALDK